MSSHRKIQLVDDTFEYAFNTKNFFSSLWKAHFDLYDLKFGSFFKKLFVDLPNATKKEAETIEDIAFELVFPALHRAAFGLVEANHPEALNQAKQLSTKNKGFRQTSKKEITQSKVYIDKEFMLFPASWEYLKTFKPAFVNFLQEELQIDIAAAWALALQINLRFWEELIKLYDSNSDKYVKVARHLNVDQPFPFPANLPHYEKRLNYYQKIRKQYERKLMNDSEMRLSDIYITPNFKIYHRHLPKSNYSQDRDGFVELACKGKHLHDYLDNYFFQKKDGFKGLKIPAEKSRLVLLLGQPGQGKTSFCYRTIHNLHDYLSDDKEFIFYKLNQLESKARQFLKTPFDVLTEVYENYGFTYKNGLLILDGLDEIFMTEGLTKSEITEFFRTLSQALQSRPNLTVVVTSRFHYVELSRLGKNDVLVLSLNPLTLVQQQSWLEKYLPFNPDCKLKVDDLVEIHAQKEGQLKGLWELVNQPILLQLVAKAEFEIKKLENRGKIYEELFDTLIQRSWDKENGQLKKFDIEPQIFREFLRALAHRIYQSDREYITLEELQNWEERTPEFIEQIQSDYESIGEALKDVLITFYFKPVEEEQIVAKSNAIEFYHKSLQEYLAMEHIWHTVMEQLTKTENTKSRKKPKYVIKDNDWKQVLSLFWSLSTPKKLTSETAQYLRDIIANDTKESDRMELAKRMTIFFNDLLTHQFLYKYELTHQYENPMQLACNCFYVYWTILSHLPKENLIITNENKKAFCDVLVIIQCLHPNYIKLQGVNLSGAYLSGAYLSGANLIGANLRRANLSGAYLSGAYLRVANLIGANLRGAYLSGTNLRGANLRGANLSGANLRGAYLRRATLSGAYLSGANLSGAYLSEANLSEADLSVADLSGAYLSVADLSVADLSVADLSEADLSGANLSGANLSGANLSGIYLKNEHWLKDIEAAKIIGFKEIIDKYEIVFVKAKESYQADHYTLRLKSSDSKSE